MDIGSIVAMIVCILFSAYFSATETAFSSLNKTKLRTIIEKSDGKHKKEKLVLKLSDEYDKLISTILVGNNIVNITLASIATVFFIRLDEINGATLATLITTLLVLIFGEITPKSIAKDMPEKFAMYSAPFINLLMYILTPLNFVFTQWKRLIALIFRIKEDNGVSSDELLTMVDEIQENGNLDVEDSQLIKNAIEFTDRRAEDIITHRVDIEAVPEDASNLEVAKKFVETQFSRLLVYKGTIDNIVGVIHLKDFITEKGLTNKAIKDIMVKPLYIQRSENINDLLKILQNEKSHIAVVIDEFGGTYGIVTMEDILEELVGEIWDEHDEVIEEYKEVEKNKFIVDCSMSFEDFCEQFDIKAESDGITVGGWVMEQLAKVPEQNDNFKFQNLDITIIEMELNRVVKISVLVGEKEIESDNE